jgi:hypothetical protein
MEPGSDHDHDGGALVRRAVCAPPIENVVTHFLNNLTKELYSVINAVLGRYVFPFYMDDIISI